MQIFKNLYFICVVSAMGGLLFGYDWVVPLRTGYPPTDKEEWIREMRICREYGLNHLRFHSWCPPEVAFEAADELGMYLQVECSVWPNTTTTLGEGKPVDKYTKEEAERIVETFGNHPSGERFSLCSQAKDTGLETGPRQHHQFQGAIT